MIFLSFINVSFLCSDNETIDQEIQNISKELLEELKLFNSYCKKNCKQLNISPKIGKFILPIFKDKKISMKTITLKENIYSQENYLQENYLQESQNTATFITETGEIIKIKINKKTYDILIDEKSLLDIFKEIDELNDITDENNQAIDKNKVKEQYKSFLNDFNEKISEFYKKNIKIHMKIYDMIKNKYKQIFDKIEQIIYRYLTEEQKTQYEELIAKKSLKDEDTERREKSSYFYALACQYSKKIQCASQYLDKNINEPQEITENRKKIDKELEETFKPSPLKYKFFNRICQWLNNKMKKKTQYETICGRTGFNLFKNIKDKNFKMLDNTFQILEKAYVIINNCTFINDYYIFLEFSNNHKLAIIYNDDSSDKSSNNESSDESSKLFSTYDLTLNNRPLYDAIINENGEIDEVKMKNIIDLLDEIAKRIDTRTIQEIEEEEKQEQERQMPNPGQEKQNPKQEKLNQPFQPIQDQIKQGQTPDQEGKNQEDSSFIETLNQKIIEEQIQNPTEQGQIPNQPEQPIQDQIKQGQTLNQQGKNQEDSSFIETLNQKIIEEQIQNQTEQGQIPNQPFQPIQDQIKQGQTPNQQGKNQENIETLNQKIIEEQIQNPIEQGQIPNQPLQPIQDQPLQPIQNQEIKDQKKNSNTKTISIVLVSVVITGMVGKSAYSLITNITNQDNIPK